MGSRPTTPTGYSLPVALNLDRLLERRAVLPGDQRRLDGGCGLLPDRVPAHLVVALAHGVGRADRRLLVADLVGSVDLVDRRADSLRERGGEHGPALPARPTAAVDARVAAAHVLHLQQVAQVLLHLSVDR